MTTNLEQLKSIAESGVVDVDWTELRESLAARLNKIIDDFAEKENLGETQEPNMEAFNLEASRNEVLKLIASFDEPPFTIQRICELLCKPFTYYRRIGAFLRGMEKNLRVVSSYKWTKTPDTTKDNIAINV